MLRINSLSSNNIPLDATDKSKGKDWLLSCQIQKMGAATSSLSTIARTITVYLEIQMKRPQAVA